MDPAPALRHVTRFGCWLTDTASPTDGSPALERISVLAAAGERAGFDSLWVTDTSGSGGAGGAGRPALEAYSLLGALATRTRTARLGAIPVGRDPRPPSMVAKIVTGIDVISHGRGILTFGMEDGRTEGEDIVAADRALPVVESVHVGRSMLDDEIPTFSGSVHSIAGAYNHPRPAQVGGVPVVVVAPGRPGRPWSSSRRPSVGAALAELAGLADAVIVPTGIADLGAVITEARGKAHSGTGGNAAGPARLQVLGVGVGEASAPGSRGPLDVAGVVASVRGLLGAGADGCLVPIDVATPPDEVARIGEALTLLG